MSTRKARRKGMRFKDLNTGETHIYQNTLDPSLNREDFDALLARGYIHSTIAGFNAEYEKYGRQFQITKWTDKLKTQAEADLTDALKRLKASSGGDNDENPVTNAVWGNPLPNVQPVQSQALKGVSTLNHHEIAYRLLNQSLAGTASLEWIEAHENWVTSYNTYLKNLIKQKLPLLQDGDKIPSALQAAARRVIQAVRSLSDTEVKYRAIATQMNLNGATSIEGKYVKAVKGVTTIKNISDISSIGIGQFSELVRNAATFFGLRTEYTRDVDFLTQVRNPNDIATEIMRGNIHDPRPVAGASKLSDFTFTVDVPSIDGQSVQQQRMGISYKLRQFDNFDLSVRVSLANLPKGIEDYNNLQYLIYLYRNIRALTEFAADKIVEHRSGPNIKRKEAYANTRYDHLVLGLKDVSQDINNFHQALTMRMLLTAFFGNAQDAGNGNVIDPDFYKNLLTKYQDPTEASAPPHYLVTSRYVYRTATVLETLIESLLKGKKVENLGTLTEIQDQYNNDGLHYTSLQRIWLRKSEYLSEVNDRNPLSQNHDKIYEVMLTYFNDIFSLKSDDNTYRNLSFKIQHHIHL